MEGAGGHPGIAPAILADQKPRPFRNFGLSKVGAQNPTVSGEFLKFPAEFTGLSHVQVTTYTTIA